MRSTCSLGGHLQLQSHTKVNTHPAPSGRDPSAPTSTLLAGFGLGPEVFLAVGVGGELRSARLVLAVGRGRRGNQPWSVRRPVSRRSWLGRSIGRSCSGVSLKVSASPPVPIRHSVSWVGTRSPPGPERLVHPAHPKDGIVAVAVSVEEVETQTTGPCRPTGSARRSHRGEGPRFGSGRSGPSGTGSWSRIRWPPRTRRGRSRTRRGCR